MGDAPQIFLPGNRGKAQVAAQAGADAVAVQDNHLHSFVKKDFFRRVGQSGFARARRPGQPEYAAAVALASLPVGTPDPRKGGDNMFSVVLSHIFTFREGHFIAGKLQKCHMLWQAAGLEQFVGIGPMQKCSGYRPGRVAVGRERRCGGS